MIFNVSGGGGTALNFRVVGGTTAPSNPKENTIWVNTSTPITDWVFSATQPTAASGRVWISTGTSSSVEFNALKKNNVMVYPMSAKQMVSGTLKDVTAKSYQGGKWVEWFDYDYLFNYGRQPYTWSPSTMRRDEVDAVSVPTVTVEDDGSVLVTYKGTSSAVAAGLYASDDAIDLSGFTALKLMCQNSSSDIVFTIFPENATYWKTNAVSYTVLSSSLAEFMIDVSGLSGAYRVGFGTRCSSGQTKTLLLKSVEGVR